jgi:hypothetical protein
VTRVPTRAWLQRVFEPLPYGQIVGCLEGRQLFTANDIEHALLREDAGLVFSPLTFRVFIAEERCPLDLSFSIDDSHDERQLRFTV